MATLWKIVVRVVYAGATALLAVCLIYAIFWMSSEAKLRDTRARIEKPGEQIFHERLVAKRAGMSLDGPIANEAVSSTVFAGLTDEAIEESLAVWAPLVDSWRSEFLKNPTWDAAREIADRPNQAVSEEDWELLAGFLETHRELLPKIRAAAELDGPVYPLDFSKGLDMDLAHFAPLRGYVYLLTINTRLQARSGDFFGALRDLETAIKLAETFAGESVFISQSVRFDLHETILFAAQEAFPPDTLSEERVRELRRLIERARAARYLPGAIVSEAYIDSYEQWRRTGVDAWDPRPYIFDQDDWKWSERFGRWLYGSPLGRPWRARHDAARVEDMIDIAELIERPFDRPYPALLNDLDEMDEVRMMAPAVFSVLGGEAPLVHDIKNWLMHVARCDLARIGFSLEWYHMQHGNFPETLSDIANEFGGTVPLDPFSDSEYRYIVTGDTMTLYSLGRYREDDGGRHERFGGDIVWRGVEDED